ncbi:MAG: EAL domain-containing protein [Gammaproteobacteria bacterium]|nr:EAL domain-containing protein [Gammaproteobacteria bacterium]
MNFHTSIFKSFSVKILIVFFIAAFIPLSLQTFFSKSYVTNFVEQEVNSNLIKNAKSFEQLTFNKLKVFSNLLDSVSASTNNSISTNSTHAFDNLKLIPIEDVKSAGFGYSIRPRLIYYRDDEDNLFFNIEKLHLSNIGDMFVLRATINSESIFGNEANNPYSEPVCIITGQLEILFCNNQKALEKVKLSNISTLINAKEHMIEQIFEDDKYRLISRELFLPSFFQSPPWHFVILKQESTILSSLWSFEYYLIPSSLLFFLIASFIVFRLSAKLLHPLNILSNATKKIAAGDYDVDIEISTNDEFMELGQSFNTMSNNLQHESYKTDVYSRLERDFLQTADIHYSIKNNLPLLLKVFDANWLVISIANPLQPELFTSHIASYDYDKRNYNYKNIKHKIDNSSQSINSLYLLDREVFQQKLDPLTVYDDYKYVWIHKIEHSRQTIGYINIGSNAVRLNKRAAFSLQDLSERFSVIYSTLYHQSMLYKKANYDSLTHLPNRSYLFTHLTAIWHHAVKQQETIALLYIDLDHFKSVNDLSGHSVGNEVLIQVGQRLHACIRKEYCLARLSGDEFCIAIENLESEQQAIQLAEKINKEFKHPFIVMDMSYYLGTSIGIIIGPEGCNSPQQFLEKADMAMFKAKQDGRSKYVLFNNTVEKERNQRLSLEHHLHHALESNEISLCYQPKLHLGSEKIVSVEALARWHQSELGMVNTEAFISLAEETGLINEIGEWILRKSCYQYIDWLEKGILLESIAVNVSARQLANNGFTNIVEAALQETGMSAQCLDLEITESAFINDTNALTKELNQLHELGVTISIDDFGKEYSSLNYLKKIPFDLIKIDREFIMDLDKDQRDQHIVKVIIDIGHTLEKKIVAEGIETIAQKDILRALKCDYGQGYLFSKPLTDIKFLEYAAKYIEQRENTLDSKSSA